MLERNFARELGEFLKNFNEDHLAKVFLGSAARPMGADQFEDERIEPADHFAGRALVMLPSRRHEGVSVEFICHVLQAISTLTGMTAPGADRLQNFRASQGSVPGNASWHSVRQEAEAGSLGENSCNRSALIPVMTPTYETETYHTYNAERAGAWRLGFGE